MRCARLPAFILNSNGPPAAPALRQTSKRPSASVCAAYCSPRHSTATLANACPAVPRKGNTLPRCITMPLETIGGTTIRAASCAEAARKEAKQSAETRRERFEKGVGIFVCLLVDEFTSKRVDEIEMFLVNEYHVLFTCILVYLFTKLFHHSPYHSPSSSEAFSSFSSFICSNCSGVYSSS